MMTWWNEYQIETDLKIDRLILDIIVISNGKWPLNQPLNIDIWQHLINS